MAVEVQPSIEVRKKLTPEDVEEMSARGDLEDRICELVDGELVDLPPAGFGHGSVAVNIVTELNTFARKAGGRVLDSSTGFRAGLNQRDVRSPDVAYVAQARLSNVDEEHFFSGAPDLAVEVLSEDQYGRAYARTKTQEYFAAGAQVVWLVDRRYEEVRVYRPNSDEYTIYRNDAVLTLEPIIAGFELKVSDIFR